MKENEQGQHRGMYIMSIFLLDFLNGNIDKEMIKKNTNDNDIFNNIINYCKYGHHDASL